MSYVVDMTAGWQNTSNCFWTEFVKGYLMQVIKNGLWDYWKHCYPYWAYDSVGYKICRFFIEEERKPNFWLAYRYYNLLLDTLATTELDYMPDGGSYWPGLKLKAEHFLYATSFNGFLMGKNIALTTRQVAPYIRYSCGNIEVAEIPNVWTYQYLTLSCVDLLEAV